MKKVTYFAVFEPSETGYSIYFPDLPGCVSCGDSIDHAMKMAKEALALHYFGLETDGETAPFPTLPPFDDLEPSDFIVPIEIFPDIIKENFESRAVKKTLTIPYWLNARAEAADVNFSQLLQNALKEYLNVG